ncbi:unnamed protein product [Blepharisma stoltei]|uniref:Uncharacterized protein n=1 Tax=Blepharisma stoltei TaxID=1481888 RepID=A0AAU9J8H8_9CILI|nr:unnamed protein product [Blepharisma stoltei]
MEFIQFLTQLPAWRYAKNTWKVKVTAPEEYSAILVEYEIMNNRHLIDIVQKIQRLPSLTESEDALGQVTMSFHWSGKFYMVYEDFEEAENIIGIEWICESFRKGIEGLAKLEKDGTWHGDICMENFKRGEKCGKLFGYALPKPRSFEGSGNVNPYKQDMKNLCQVLLDTTGCQESFEKLAEAYGDLEELKMIKRIVESELETIPTALDILDLKNSLARRDRYKDGTEDRNINEGQMLFFTKNDYLQSFSISLEPKISKIIKNPLGKGSSIGKFKGDLIITGGCGTENNTFKYNAESMLFEILPAMLSNHQFHTSIEFSNSLWVIGGISSKSCESWDGNHWNVQPELRYARESPSAYISDTLYVFSGGVERLEGNSWTLLSIELNLIGCFGLVKDSQIIIFGGRELATYNDEILIYSLDSPSIQERREGFTGLFGSNPFYESGNAVCVPSNSGKIVQFNTISKQLILL